MFSLFWHFPTFYWILDLGSFCLFCEFIIFLENLINLKFREIIILRKIRNNYIICFVVLLHVYVEKEENITKL